jgi:pimeloyl-ACP methyl ester carboxylesterase
MAWRHVQQPISEKTRACAYDRAGYGFSDPATRPADAKNAVEDLHDLLRRAGITMPIVLVGHSRGGQYATLYTELYPQDVAGLVLIDPSFAQQDEQLNAVLTPEQRAAHGAEESRKFARNENCRNLASDGTLAWLVQSPCLDNPPNADPVLHAVLNREYSTPAYWTTVVSEQHNAHAPMPGHGPSSDDAEMPAGGPHFGAMPLVVLTSEAMASPSWIAGHAALAAASTRGSNSIVKGSGHYVQDDQPASVIEAVGKVLSAVRQGLQ